jgi:epoxyqueuosine reductase QueG
MKERIQGFVAQEQANVLQDQFIFPIWDEPLVGVASCADPLWHILKQPEVVGPQHRSPQEWLPRAQAVVSYFLPFTQAIRQSNWEDGLPSKEWLYGRYEGEMINHALARYIAKLVIGAGGEAVVPVLDYQFAQTDSRSNWSERHVAYIAGLGTFSLTRALITAKGAAGRFGSVVVDLELVPTPRLYEEKDEYCSKCGACISRCPVQAIDDKGKDHRICCTYIDQVRDIYQPKYGCGKCQTHVPCESVNPRRS